MIRDNFFYDTFFEESLVQLKAYHNVIYSVKNMEIINIIKMPYNLTDEKKQKAIKFRIQNLTQYPNYFVTLAECYLPLFLQKDDLTFKLKKTKKEVIIKIYKKKEGKILNNEKEDIKFNMPENFKGQLDWYQKEGVNWMLNRLNKAKGCILADDMGLGKTIQIIVTLLHLKNKAVINNTNKAIILVPKTLVKQWFSELMKFAPTLKVFVYGSEKNIPECDIIVFSHNQAYLKYEVIEKLNIHLLIIDEAHRVKTPEALITKRLKKIRYEKVILATGTPFENSIKDGLCLIDFIYDNFYDNMLEQLKSNNFTWQYFSFIMRCFSSSFLRRIKNKKTLPSLPNKTIIDVKCKLADLQRKDYEELIPLRFNYKQIYKAVGGPLITKLKRICNDTFYLKKNPKYRDENSKIVNLLKIYNALPKGEKLIVVSQFTISLDDIELALKAEGLTNILKFNGTLSSKQRNEALINFRQSSDTTILLLSLKAGGIGLNLQEATNVIMYDLWWNRTAETQAIDRTFRRGQLKDVTVYRFINNIPFEESILRLVRRKNNKINLIWKALKGSITNLPFKEQNQIYSFIDILRFNLQELEHTPLYKLDRKLILNSLRKFKPKKKESDKQEEDNPYYIND